MSTIIKSILLLLMLTGSTPARLHEFDSMPSSHEESQQPPLSTERIAERILRATVTIISYDRYGDINGTGSGFFVSPNSIITNHHVIEEAHSIKYRIQGSEILYEFTRRRSVDTVNDSALLETTRSSNNVIRLSNTGVRIGQTIYVAGAPRMLESTFSNGIVSALRSESGVEWIQITAPVSAGSSGGPVVDSNAELVGVTVGTIRDGQNLNFAVPTKYVQNLIQSPLTVASTPATPSNRTFLCGDMMMDQDGNRYKTVQIGEQCWMAENLRTSKYRDGTPIPNVTGNSQWGSLTTGAWATYDNSAANNATYGKLYNWYAVADARNVCPVGWHVPSDDEWTMLSTHLGTDPGHKMKSASGWSGGNGLNASGFNGLPGGSRNRDGTFSNVGKDGHFWSSTQDDNFMSSIQDDSDYPWGRSLDSDSRNLISFFTLYEEHGYSVRCLRD